MKKAMALALVLIMALAFAGSATAANYTAARFDIATSSITEFKTGCYDLKKKDNSWYVSLTESSSNLSPTHRAVARVHQFENAVSATWVYSGSNSTVHPYTADCQGYQKHISFRARLDDRDSGLLEFHGYFNYIKWY